MVALEREATNMAGNLGTAERALNFILAGNATFTVRSLKTGTRYTYKVRRAESVDTNQRNLPLPELARRNAAEAAARPTWFVTLLSGPDNENDFVYLGIITDNVFRLTRKSRMTSESVPVRAFGWVYAALVRREMPALTEIWHEGRCGRCGRKLTVPESIVAGLGPECAGRDL